MLLDIFILAASAPCTTYDMANCVALDLCSTAFRLNMFSFTFQIRKHETKTLVFALAWVKTIGRKRRMFFCQRLGITSVGLVRLTCTGG